jgi:hypothetical protein
MMVVAPPSIPIAVPMIIRTQAHIHVAVLSMLCRGDDRFSRAMRHVRSDRIGHGKTEDIERGRDHEGVADPEEPADDPDGKTEQARRALMIMAAVQGFDRLFFVFTKPVLPL